MYKAAFGKKKKKKKKRLNPSKEAQKCYSLASSYFELIEKAPSAHVN